MWHPVITKTDGEALLSAFGFFHDACIHELHLWGGYYVSPDFKMTCPDTPDLKCRLIVQRQRADPSAVELLFDRVSHIAIATPAGYDRIISAATLRMEEQKIVWSPDYDFEKTEPEFGVASVIESARLWWRPVATALGPELKYAPIREVPDGFAL
ncbi:hypothetical protein [Zoogloea sp.]|uniref:hypothetical protein n=1 Tax=Zoogloea sp. TaxID=49181 RepID=UPI001AC5B16D|nr:hypothetical protein [Zoogloea sp.]MBN8285002.1 hypothetical protein [Zoogloea sp.]